MPKNLRCAVPTLLVGQFVARKLGLVPLKNGGGPTLTFEQHARLFITFLRNCGGFRVW